MAHVARPSGALFHHTEPSALSGLCVPSPPRTGAQEMRPRRPPSTSSAGASGAAVGGVAAAAAPAARATSTRVARTRAAWSEPRWRPKWSLPAPLPPRPPLSWPSLSRATSGDGHGGVGARYGSGSVLIVCVGTDVARMFVQLVCCLDGRMARWSVYPTLGQSSRWCVSAIKPLRRSWGRFTTPYMLNSRHFEPFPHMICCENARECRAPSRLRPPMRRHVIVGFG